MSISVVIPAYEQYGKGAEHLTHLLNTLQTQTAEYDVTVVDSANNDSIKKVCEQFGVLCVPGVRGASENINAAISAARSEKVKIMCQDDFFTSPHALKLFSEALDKNGWVISNSIRYDGDLREKGRMATGYTHGSLIKNKTGMPSVIGFRKNDLRFDTTLKTICDLYFYHQLYELYGQPGVISEYCIGQRYHNASQSRNQPNRHQLEVERLIRQGKIPGKAPKVVVAVIVYNRPENLKYWVNQDVELYVIHNDNGEDYSHLCGRHTYIRRPNVGYDIGAMQDVFRGRLPGFPMDWDYLLWCTDDTIPIRPTVIEEYLEGFTKRVGVVCMHLSGEITPHIRTTGFMIDVKVAAKTKFPTDPVKTKEDCHNFEYKGLSFYKQVIAQGFKIAQVSPLPYSPLYDMNYWSRNENARLLKHILYREIQEPHHLQGLREQQPEKVH